MKIRKFFEDIKSYNLINPRLKKENEGAIKSCCFPISTERYKIRVDP